MTTATPAPLGDRIAEFRRQSPEHKKLLQLLRETPLRGADILGSRAYGGDFQPPADNTILHAAREACTPIEELRDLVNILPRLAKARETLADREMKKLIARREKLTADVEKLHAKRDDATTDRERDRIDDELFEMEKELAVHRHSPPEVTAQLARQTVDAGEKLGL